LNELAGGVAGRAWRASWSFWGKRMSIEKIAVLGLGKVGQLAATLLHEGGFGVTGVDAWAPAQSLPFAVRAGDAANGAFVAELFSEVDAVLSCLPYHLNTGLAQAAHAAGIHYFDLTEDVPTTNSVIELARSSRGLMAPQCGLAPGFVGIVGASLANGFDRCRSIRMRVGALPQHPTGLLGYAFNWSPEGVVNEYLNDCEVIEDGVRKLVSPMEWLETIYVGGVKLDAFTTSGGLGTMCDTLLGKVDNVDYKTMRYPGHMELMNFFFHELLMRDRRALAGEILTNAKPPVDDDVVYVHVAAEGTQNGSLRRKEFVRAYYPIEIAGARRTAIAWTTSASVVAVVEMVRDGLLPATGFLHQEHIPLNLFLRTPTGSLFKSGATEHH
jgi:saccharopine dehydrogenase-like NADP-dependent oxidoreductase